MLLQNLINPKSANCTCSDSLLEAKMYTLDQELMKLGDIFILNKRYEVGKDLSKADIFSIIYRRKRLIKQLNKQCTSSIDQIHTEETCVNKPCH